MPSSHLILSRPLLFPSIRVFSNESAIHIRWPKFWSFSFNISPSNEHPGLIPFRMDWLDLLVIQGNLKSLLQPHSSKASILQRSASVMVQLSHLYATTGDSCHTRLWPREKSQLWLEAQRSWISFPFSFGRLSTFLSHHVQARLFHDSF